MTYHGLATETDLPNCRTLKVTKCYGMLQKRGLLAFEITRQPVIWHRTCSQYNGGDAYPMHDSLECPKMSPNVP